MAAADSVVDSAFNCADLGDDLHGRYLASPVGHPRAVGVSYRSVTVGDDPFGWGSLQIQDALARIRGRRRDRPDQRLARVVPRVPGDTGAQSGDRSVLYGEAVERDRLDTALYATLRTWVGVSDAAGDVLLALVFFPVLESGADLWDVRWDLAQFSGFPV